MAKQKSILTIPNFELFKDSLFDNHKCKCPLTKCKKCSKKKKAIKYGPHALAEGHKEVNIIQRNVMLLKKQSKPEPPHQSHKDEMSKNWTEYFERTEQKKMLKIFQKLRDTNLPVPKRDKKLSSADKEKMLAWIETNAKPRKIPRPSKPKRKWKPLEQLKERIEKLSKPKFPKMDLVSVTLPKIKKPVPLSDRISHLAMPKLPRKKWIAHENSRKGKKTVSYYPSLRLLEIAAPRKVPESKNHCRYNPFRVRRGALKYEATPRIIELAKPKNYDEDYEDEEEEDEDED